jgi:L-gulonolactone oxidase
MAMTPSRVQAIRTQYQHWKGWRNWGRNQSCRPVAFDHPTGTDELADVVKQAGAAGQTVKVVGSGHSFTDIACTDGRMVVLDRHDGVLDVDQDARTVTVQSGITIARLNEELAVVGLAMPNLGDIAYQTIAGAISTATHGTGVRLGNISSQVKALELVTGDGSVVACSATENPDLWRAGRVGVGAIGVISTVTLQCVPAFRLRALELPRKLDDVLADLDAQVDGNEHFEFFWFPHTEMCATKTNNTTDEPLHVKTRYKAWRDDIVLSNYVFGAVCALGKVRPALIPRLSQYVGGSLGKVRIIDRSDRVFASPRLVRFVEMEYAIPRADAVSAITAIRDLIDGSGLHISFPVEVRFVAGDDAFLSPAHERDTCYIAVHVYRGMEFEPYFRGVEEIMSSFGGRPHWGKMHFQTATTLAPRYPQWDAFQAARSQVDPEGRFRNAYTDRVLGPLP